eukprot:jgi/Mesvir1/9639/Mv12135-RA.1
MMFTFIDYVTCRGRLAANDPALDSVNYKFLSVRQLRERLEELLRQRNEWKLAHLNVSRRVAVLSKQVDMDQQFMLAIRDNSVPRIRQLVSVALRRGRSVQFIVHQMGQAIKGLYRAKGFASDDKARDLGALVAATGAAGRQVACSVKQGWEFTCQSCTSVLAEKWESRTEKPLKMEFDTVEDIEDVLSLLEGGKLHLAVEALVFCLCPYRQDRYTAVPFLIMGCCKESSAKLQQAIFGTIEKVLHDLHAEGKLGLVLEIGTDGQAQRRQALNALCGKAQIQAAAPFYTPLLRMPLLDTVCSAVQGVTFCADLKHLLKRFRTRVISRLKGVQVRDVTLTREDLYNLLEKAGVSTLAALFEPVDKQNVPAAVKLLEAVASLRLGAHDLAVTAQDALTAARLLGSLFEGLIAPLRQLNLDLGRQLELASRSAHLLFVLYRLVSTKLVPSVLYHDTMVHITTLFSNVMKIQAYFPGQRYYIFQQGTDREELVFGDARTQSHNNTFTVLEAHDRFATAAQIRGIYEKHPEWQTPSRLLVRSYDHINTKSITGDMTVTPALDVAGCFERGAQEAALTLAQSGWWDADAADLDFTFLYNQGVSLRCPFRAGEIVGVTARVGDEVEEARRKSGQLRQPLIQRILHRAACQTLWTCKTQLQLRQSCWTMRQSRWRTRFGSKAAAKEARAQSAYRDGDEDTVAAVPVPTAKGALFTVPDLIEEQLGYPDTTVTGPMLYLSPERAIAGASDEEGAGHEGEVMHVWRDEGRSGNFISAAGPFVRPCPFQLQPRGIDGQLLPVLLESALRDIMDELLAKHDAMTLTPWRASCRSQNLDLPLPRFARRGWCSETTCKVTLTSKRGGVQATVACSSFTKFNYASAAKYSKSSPCTNVPRVCGVCPGGNTIVWSYDYLNHLQLKHAERPCTLDEIEKYAITGLECREVLNKYLGISFEKVFLPKLKVQVGLLRDTSEVALFWKKVLGDL